MFLFFLFEAADFQKISVFNMILTEILQSQNVWNIRQINKKVYFLPRK